MPNRCFFYGCNEEKNLVRCSEKGSNAPLRRSTWFTNSNIDFVAKPLKKNTKDVRVCRKHFHIKCFKVTKELKLSKSYGTWAIRSIVIPSQFPTLYNGKPPNTTESNNYNLSVLEDYRLEENNNITEEENIQDERWATIMSKLW